jgi:hypothetical protein
VTDLSPHDSAEAAYWKGYAAGLSDRAAPCNPRGWIFLALVALCLLLWTFTIAVMVWLL